MKRRFEAAFMALALTACAGTQVMLVPELLLPPADQKLAMTVHAKGVQVHECRASGAACERLSWVQRPSSSTAAAPARSSAARAPTGGGGAAAA